MTEDRLRRQLEFIVELDKAKAVLRRNPLVDGSRRENDGEHMWHLAVMAIVLAEHAEPPVDVIKVMRMLLLHDVVEIDAGDVFVYDDAAREGQAEREQKAADRIYGLLPDDQAEELRTLWEEFEARETPESKFAAAIDRLQPLLLNHASGGGAWRDHGITSDRVYARNAAISTAAPALWARARELIGEAVERGHLLP